jgi:nucleotide-binding universal stress UspA family protein
MSPAIRTQMGFYLDDQQRKKILDDRVSYTIDRIKKRLSTFSEKELKDYPKAGDRIESIQVCEGFPADAILEKANELECDAIVMGTHGKGIIANTFLGSVTKRVLRRTRKPVYIIPLPRGETDITMHDD